MGMAEKEQTRTIEGVTYLISPMSFDISREALIRFGKICGPFIANLATARGGDEASKHEAVKNAIQAIVALVSNEDLKYFDSVFAPRTKYIDHEGKEIYLKPVLVVHFDDKLDAYFQWLRECILINWSKAFSTLLGKVATPTGEVAPAATTPA